MTPAEVKKLYADYADVSRDLGYPGGSDRFNGEVVAYDNRGYATAIDHQAKQIFSTNSHHLNWTDVGDTIDITAEGVGRKVTPNH